MILTQISANSGLRNNLQFDQPPLDGPAEIIFRASCSPDTPDIGKVDRAVGLDARGRIKVRMIDDADGDDVRSRKNPAATLRRQRP